MKKSFEIHDIEDRRKIKIKLFMVDINCDTSRSIYYQCETILRSFKDL